MAISISLAAFFEPCWLAIKDLANSQFGSQLLGAMAGALGGAYAAQKIAATNKQQDILHQEIRHTSAAIELAAMLTGTYFNLKGQIIRPLATEYAAQRSEAHDHYQMIQSLPVGARLPRPPAMRIALNSISKPHTRFERLEDIVVSKLSVAGRVRPLMAMFVQCAHSLDDSITNRSDLLALYRSDAHSQAVLVHLIFGLPYEGGVDDRYSQNIEALVSQTDDCIQFGMMLTDDLVAHSQKLRVRYKKQFGVDVPATKKVIWDIPKKRGLLPNAEGYADWNSTFIAQMPPTRGRRLAKLGFACRRIARSSVLKNFDIRLRARA